MSPEDAVGASSLEGRATPPAVRGIPATVPPVDATGDASRRGGRIDFATATDLVDEASQESFPASDSPAWTFLEDHQKERQRDWTMDKKNIVNRTHEQTQPTSEPAPAPEGRGEIDPTGAVREHVAALAYELWESHGRPEGTDLEDWFEAERQLRLVTKSSSLGDDPEKVTIMADADEHKLSDAIPHQHPEAGGDRGGRPVSTRKAAAEQIREAKESKDARRAKASNRDRMVDIGRGNQQTGRQGR